MIELKEDLTISVAGDCTRQNFRPFRITVEVEVEADWSVAANTASAGDDFDAWTAISEEVFDSWEASLKDRQ